MEAIHRGIGLVTEDRKSQGLLLPQSIRVNTTLSDLASVSHWGLLNITQEVQAARRWIDALRVRCSSEDQEVSALSGGCLLYTSRCV